MDSTSSDTAALVARAQDDGEAGFGGLYRRLTPALSSWARLRIGDQLGRSLAPEDLVQEVWWEALRHFERFDPERGDFRRWIFGIATNLLLQARRRLGVRGELGAHARHGRREPLHEGLSDEATAITRRARRSEAAQRFVHYVQKLEDDDRQLIIHCGLEDLPIKDAAGLLGISEAAAFKRWQRLRKRIREDLNEDADALLAP